MVDWIDRHLFVRVVQPTPFFLPLSDLHTYFYMFYATICTEINAINHTIVVITFVKKTHTHTHTNIYYICILTVAFLTSL